MGKSELRQKASESRNMAKLAGIMLLAFVVGICRCKLNSAQDSDSVWSADQKRASKSVKDLLLRRDAAARFQRDLPNFDITVVDPMPNNLVVDPDSIMISEERREFGKKIVPLPSFPEFNLA